MDESSGVGVVDKTTALLDAVAARPCSLAELVTATGIPRPTAHRLAVALEHHGLLDRDADGRFRLGPRLVQWAGSTDPLLSRARPVVIALRDGTGLSAQVYRRQGDQRLCIAAAEPASGLRDGVPVGALLTMQAGSAAQVLTAWLEPDERSASMRSAAFDDADLARVRRRGWAHSVAQREPGVASVSAPVRDRDGLVVAAISLSGPLDRLESPARGQVTALLAAAADLSVR